MYEALGSNPALQEMKTKTLKYHSNSLVSFSLYNYWNSFLQYLFLLRLTGANRYEGVSGTFTLVLNLRYAVVTQLDFLHDEAYTHDTDRPSTWAPLGKCS